MKDLINPSYLEKFKREEFRAYRRLFSGTIKETFLINVLSKITLNPRANNIFLKNFNPNVAFSAESTVLGRSYSRINICKMIVMLHYINTFELTDSERGKKQEDKQYLEKLIDDVLKMMTIEKITVSDFSASSLESFLPIVYYTTALTNYCENKHSELFEHNISVSKPYNYKFNSDMLYKILLRIRACVALVDTRATDELMILFRSLAELFMTYAAIWDKSEPIISSYLKYNQVTFEFNRGGAIPNIIKEMAKRNKVDPVKCLNYGWIQELEEYKKLPKNKQTFGLGILAEIVDIKYGKGFGTDLYRIYKSCNPQTHGTMFVMNYFELELSIFQNIAVMLKFICRIMSEELFSFDFKFDGLDLIDELNATLNQSRTASATLLKNSDLPAKTNIDYRNRFICSLRMKN